MSATNRAKKIAKIQSVLKKNYQPVTPPSNRTVLEHLVFACCLEDSEYDPANDAFARLQEMYTGWNEVRVTTVAELSESMTDLTDPIQAATRVKKTLYNVFESQYSWDLEPLRKENLGKAVQKLSSYKSSTPFIVSYVVQSALGGHSIPIDQSAMDLMLLLEIVTEKEAAIGTVPGLERAITKTAGVAFGSMLHQLAVAFRAAPFSTNVRNIILSIDSSAKDRFPKRQTKKKAAEKKATEKKTESKEPAKSVKKAAPAKKATTKKEATKKAAPKKATPAKKTAEKKTAKTAAKKAVKKTPAKKSANKKLSKKKPR